MRPARVQPDVGVSNPTTGGTLAGRAQRAPTGDQNSYFNANCMHRPAPPSQVAMVS